MDSSPCCVFVWDGVFLPDAMGGGSKTLYINDGHWSSLIGSVTGLFGEILLQKAADGTLVEFHIPSVADPSCAEKLGYMTRFEDTSDNWDYYNKKLWQDGLLYYDDGSAPIARLQVEGDEGGKKDDPITEETEVKQADETGKSEEITGKSDNTTKEVLPKEGEIINDALKDNKLTKVGKNAFKGVKKKAAVTIYAKDKKTYKKVVKLIKKSGAKNMKYKFKKKK